MKQCIAQKIMIVEGGYTDKESDLTQKLDVILSNFVNFTIFFMKS